MSRQSVVGETASRRTGAAKVGLFFLFFFGFDSSFESASSWSPKFFAARRFSPSTRTRRFLARVCTDLLSCGACVTAAAAATADTEMMNGLPLAEGYSAESHAALKPMQMKVRGCLSLLLLYGTCGVPTPAEMSNVSQWTDRLSPLLSTATRCVCV